MSKKAATLLGLEGGWHFGEGETMKEESIYIAAAIERLAEKEKLGRHTEAFPTLDGYANLRIEVEGGILGLIAKTEEDILVYFETEREILDRGTTGIKGLKEYIKEKKYEF